MEAEGGAGRRVRSVRSGGDEGELAVAPEEEAPTRRADVSTWTAARAEEEVQMTASAVVVTALGEKRRSRAGRERRRRRRRRCDRGERLSLGPAPPVRSSAAPYQLDGLAGPLQLVPRTQRHPRG